MSSLETIIDPRAQDLMRRAGGSPGGNAAVSANPGRPEVTTSFEPTPAPVQVPPAASTSAAPEGVKAK